MNSAQTNHRTLQVAFALLVGLGVSGTCGDASAQIVHGMKPEFRQGLTFLSWDVKGDTEFTIQEWHVPVMYRTGIRENVELAVYGALMNAEADWSAADNTINGVTDSKAQVSASFLDDQLLLSGGLSLPTGRKELTREQQALLSWLASDFLNFPIKNPGEGLNLFGQIGLATPLGQWVVGAAAAVYMAGEYTPYDNNRKYRPGSRMVGNVGAERVWPSRHKLGADFIFIYSTDDEVDGKAVFRDGVQLDSRLTGLLALGKAELEGGLRYIIRAKDQLPGSGGELVGEINNRHGNDLRLHALGRMLVGTNVSAWVSLDGKFLAANKYPKAHPFSEEKAQLNGLGGGLDFNLSPHSKAGLGLRAWSGSSDGALGLDALEFSGLEVTQFFSMTF